MDFGREAHDTFILRILCEGFVIKGGKDKQRRGFSDFYLLHYKVFCIMTSTNFMYLVTLSAAQTI
jgi:hypothetical protein